MIEYLTLGLAGAAAALALAVLLTRPKQGVTPQEFGRLSQELQEEMRALRTELSGAIHATVQTTAELQANTQRQVADAQNTRLRELNEQLSARQSALQKAVTDQLGMIEQRMKTGSLESEQKLENFRATMEARITAMQTDNGKRLDEMRRTVDEKLQKTLDEKLQQSFSRVSEQLESVYKGLGEMQALATGVGDLKKVLSNVKTRGILGEIQLGAILEQLLAPEQYEENVATVKGSANRVEYAVKLPGDGSSPVYLPIDAKFPIDAYNALLDAYDAADAAQAETAAKQLEQRIRLFAKDIHTKYIHVPETTDFGIMFLPVEGLYAEVVRRGMVERLQNEFKVIVAGPTTMAALLNSLQMGFRTLAIQKRSSEVWDVLSAVKQEFETFGAALVQTQKRLNQASNDLENLVGVRTRQIQRRLRGVTLLPDAQAKAQPENLLDS